MKELWGTLVQTRSKIADILTRGHSAVIFLLRLRGSLSFSTVRLISQPAQAVDHMVDPLYNMIAVQRVGKTFRFTDLYS